MNCSKRFDVEIQSDYQLYIFIGYKNSNINLEAGDFKKVKTNYISCQSLTF